MLKNRTIPTTVVALSTSLARPLPSEDDFEVKGGVHSVGYEHHTVKLSPRKEMTDLRRRMAENKPDHPILGDLFRNKRLSSLRLDTSLTNTTTPTSDPPLLQGVVLTGIIVVSILSYITCTIICIVITSVISVKICGKRQRNSRATTRETNVKIATQARPKEMSQFKMTNNSAYQAGRQVSRDGAGSSKPQEQFNGMTTNAAYRAGSQGMNENENEISTSPRYLLSYHRPNSGNADVNHPIHEREIDGDQLEDNAHAVLTDSEGYVRIPEELQIN